MAIDTHGLEPKPNPGGALLGNALRILIVDDSLSMRRIVRRFLENSGCGHVLEAGDGLAALDVLAAEPVDLIVSDFHMPRMDGMAFLEQVKESPEYRDIPFVMLTVEAIQKSMNQALSMGVDSYIVKPVTESVFISELARVLAERQK